MSDLPNITTGDVGQLIAAATEIQEIGRGGQKVVYCGTIEGKSYALKFAKAPEISEDVDTDEFSVSDVAIRAKREVEIMRNCPSNHMVKLGPIGLEFAEVGEERVLYFSEELIDGNDLAEIFRTSGRFAAAEIVKLGLHITDAIQGLWDIGKFHRDIKPANLMRRDSNGDYVLLDAGVAFDVAGESVSIGPVGTPAYFSPEQFDFTKRRTGMDFRSDIFSLGVTMYKLLTGQHPFYSPGDTSHSLYDKIVSHVQEPPSSLVGGVSKELDRIILRMLGKSPHLRYRRCNQLIDALNQV